MIEPLRNVCAAMTPAWNFSYGRRDFNNLEEADSESDRTVFCFLDPVKSRKDRSTDTGSPTGWNIYEGRMMLLVKSFLDEVYDNQHGVNPANGKFQKNILPFHEPNGYLETLENELTCSSYDWIFERWDVTDLINVFDENMDGVLIDFRIKAREGLELYTIGEGSVAIADDTFKMEL